MAEALFFDSSGSEFEGFEADTSVNVSMNVSDVDVSSVSSVNTADLSDFSDRETDNEQPNQWSKQLKHTIKKEFRGAPPGPAQIMQQQANEMDFFNLFFSNELIEVGSYRCFFMISFRRNMNFIIKCNLNALSFIDD